VFKSFFPSPRLFLLSAVVFTAIAVGFWYVASPAIEALLGISPAPTGEDAPIGMAYFFSSEFLLFYVYFVVCCATFAVGWFYFSPHPWQWWSVVGTMLIIFSSYYSVQVDVAINNWRRPFFDKVQDALSGKSTTTAAELYELTLVFAEIALIWIVIYTATRFFVSHYIFRWRTAMNDYYMSRWRDVRNIEGAAQRVQEDTMRFATITEDLGIKIIESAMTLFAFLPLLFALSVHVTQLPLVGKIPATLLTIALVWSLLGTVLLAVVGIKLPGLQFRNQRVEAAYRKELVFGEDDAARADPPTVRELFSNVRTNYFRLYFHYAYFNIFRAMYIQADNIFVYIILVPTIAAGKITFGILQQILTAFQQVSSSFQFLVNSWPTIIELLSIHKRLAAFEAAFEGEALPEIEREGEHVL
jgi:peptide/bleomycin uptake transporter